MKCMFSGEMPDNEEHIIPKWLQSRYSLYDKQLHLPNGTDLFYKYAKIPVRTEDNNAFSIIENNISKGIFNHDEIYLWALKIHIGLIYRDSTLKFDRQKKDSNMILNIGDFENEVYLFRMLYKNWKSGGTTTPSPFGSVHIFESLMPGNNFDFINSFVIGSVCFNFDGKFIAVFLWDQGDGYIANIKDSWTNHHKPFLDTVDNVDKKESLGYLAQHVWACEQGYWLYRHRRNFNMGITEKNISLIPPLSRREGMQMNLDEYRYVCRSHGLELIEYDELTGPKYRQLGF